MAEASAAGDVQALRKEFLLDSEVTFLNHGSFGACPEPVMRTCEAWARELERNPVEFMLRRATGLVQWATEALADHVGCSADDLVLLPNATYALNMVARSLSLSEGDRVLTTDHEYGAIDRLWEFVCERTGATLVRCPLPLPVHSEADVVSAIASMLDGRVRVVSLSHISSPTGLLFPVDGICRLARESGATTVVDGAHAPGQIDLDISSIGADFYVGNCHKWLCSPKVAGFLHSRPGAGIRIDPLVVSWGWDEEDLADRAHWPGTPYLPALLSVPAAIEYQRNWAAVRERCATDAAHVHERLLALPGVMPVSDADLPMFRQMVSVLLPRTVDANVQQRLFAEHSIELPVNEWHSGLLMRVSVGAYNDRDDLDRLVDALGPMLGR